MEMKMEEMKDKGGTKVMKEEMRRWKKKRRRKK